MIRRRLFALGSCCLLGACGTRFSGADATGGASGTSIAGSGASQAAHAGSGSKGEPAGDAGDESGGSGEIFEGGSAGALPDDEAAGAAGGLPIGHGGNAGAGGGAEQPVIPQLGLALWLRADYGVQQAGGVVEAWLDQSGNQLNATQMDAGVRPTYAPKGLDGAPGLKFDGKTQFLNLPKGFADFSRGVAGFMVVHPLDSDCDSVLEFSNGTEIDDIALGMWQDKWTYEVEDPTLQSGAVDLLLPSLYSANHQPIVGLDNAFADLRINGVKVQRLEMPVPKIVVRQSNFVGRTKYSGCNYFKGTLSEIILYQRVVTTSEVKAIQDYLAQHWDLGPVAAP